VCKKTRDSVLRQQRPYWVQPVGGEDGKIARWVVCETAFSGTASHRRSNTSDSQNTPRSSSMLIS